MPVFLDFEASSLSKLSYPIEVGWVTQDGTGAGALIRPAPEWTDWDADAAAIHGISREELLDEGIDPAAVCDQLIAVWAEGRVYASAPSWDGAWLSRLLRAAGRPRHLLRLVDSEEIFREAARSSGVAPNDIEAAITAARVEAEAGGIAHRAIQDAAREWKIWTLLKGLSVGPVRTWG